MPSASILTFSGDQNLSGSLATREVIWDTETKYLDANVDFWDVAAPADLVIPSSLDGVPYELFIWVEDTANTLGSTGVYLGVLDRSGAPTGFQKYWGITRDAYRASRGWRSGLLPGLATPATYYSAVREFDSRSYILRGTHCRFGVISGNPNPLAIGAAREIGRVVNADQTLACPQVVDVGSCYNPTTGIYTAPPGTSMMVPSLTGKHTGSTSGTFFEWQMRQNGLIKASFHHGGSLRCHSPGCFGLWECSPGDQISFYADRGSNRTLDIAHSVEFY